MFFRQRETKRIKARNAELEATLKEAGKLILFLSAFVDRQANGFLSVPKDAMGAVNPTDLMTIFHDPIRDNMVLTKRPHSEVVGFLDDSVPLPLVDEGWKEYGDPERPEDLE